MSFSHGTEVCTFFSRRKTQTYRKGDRNENGNGARQRAQFCRFSVFATLFAPQVETSYDAAAMLVTFVLFGYWMEMRSRRGSSDALNALLRLAPSQANVVGSEGQMHTVPVEQVQVGEKRRRLATHEREEHRRKAYTYPNASDSCHVGSHVTHTGRSRSAVLILSSRRLACVRDTVCLPPPRFAVLFVQKKRKTWPGSRTGDTGSFSETQTIEREKRT